MKKIESHSSNIGITNKRFILPSGLQILLYLLISVLLLIVFNLLSLWRYLNNVVLAPNGGLDGIIADRSSGLHQFLNAASQSLVLQILFWMCVGCLIYIFIWFLRNISTSIINDLIADKFVHPSSYNRLFYWESIIARRFFFGASLTLLIVELFAAFRLLSAMSVLCYGAVSHFQIGNSLMELGLAVLSTAGMLYIFVLLAHVTVNSWRFIYKDL